MIRLPQHVHILPHPRVSPSTTDALEAALHELLTECRRLEALCVAQERRLCELEFQAQLGRSQRRRSHLDIDP